MPGDKEGFKSPEEVAAAKAFEEEKDKNPTRVDLLGMSEVRDLLDRFKPGDNTRKNIENIFSSNDPNAGDTSTKLKLLLSGQYTGVYSQEYQNWRNSESFKRLSEYQQSGATESTSESDLRRNQAKAMIDQLQPKIESMKRWTDENPDDRTSKMELFKLSEEMGYWKKILDQGDNISKLETQVKPQTK